MNTYPTNPTTPTNKPTSAPLQPLAFSLQPCPPPPLDLFQLCKRHNLYPFHGAFTFGPVIEAFQAKIQTLRRKGPPSYTEYSADHLEWKLQIEDLEETLAQIHAAQTQSQKPAPAATPPLPSEKSAKSAVKNPSSQIPQSQISNPPSPSHPKPAANPVSALSVLSDLQTLLDSSTPTTPPTPSVTSVPSVPFVPSIPDRTPIPDSPVLNPSNPTSSHIPNPIPPTKTLAPFKPRANDKLFQLPEPDQQQLLDWLETSTCLEVAARAAKPRADGGLDLQTSKSALSRYYQRRKLLDALQDAAENNAALADTTAPTPREALGLIVQSKSLHAATLHDFDTNPRLFQFLARYHAQLENQHLRHRALDLHHKRLAFHIQTFQYDTFKRLMHKLPELNRILAQKHLSPEEIVHQAFTHAFGLQTTQTVDQANANYRESFPDADHAATELQVDPADLIQTEDTNTTMRQGSLFIQKTLGVLRDDPQLHAEADAFRARMVQKNEAWNQAPQSP